MLVLDFTASPTEDSAMRTAAWVMVVVGLCSCVKQQPRERRAHLQSAPVAARALKMGHVLTTDDVVLRSIPGDLASRIVPPDEVSFILNQPVAVPMAEGQPFDWTFFDVTRSDPLRGVCDAAIERRLGPPPTQTVSSIRAKVAPSSSSAASVVMTSLAMNEDATLVGSSLHIVDVPGDFSTTVYVTGDAFEVVTGLKTSAPLEAGTALMWSHLADRRAEFLARACIEAVGAELAPEVERTVEVVLKRVEAKDADAEVIAPVGDGEVDVVVAARALVEGTVLTERDLKVQRVPARLITASWIANRDLQKLIGARVVLEAPEGSPVWWQMLDTRDGINGTASCLERRQRAIDEVMTRGGRAAADAWVAKEGASW